MGGRGGFASGKFSVAICDECGFKYRYKDAIRDRRGFYNCPYCGVDEEDYIARILVDRVGLEHPRVDVNTALNADGTPVDPTGGRDDAGGGNGPDIPGDGVAAINDLVNGGTGLDVLVDVTNRVGTLSRLLSSTASLTIARALDGVSAEFSIGYASAISDGLMSAAHFSKLDALPTGGFLTDAPDDDFTYARKQGGWIQLVTTGIAEAPNDGEQYVRQNEGWSELAPSVEEAPNDGQGYIRKSLAWQLSPEAAAARVEKATTITGPATHAFVAGDIGKLTRCDCTGGMVEIVFNDDVAVASGFQAPSFFKRIGTGSNPLRFSPGTADTPATISVGTRSLKFRTSGVSGTQMAAASNTPQSVTIPAGTSAAVAIVYIVVGALVATPADSTGYLWNGAARSWSSQNTASGNRMKIWIDFIPLGNLASDTVYTFQPNWIDPSNVNSYAAAFVPCYGVNQLAPATTPQLLQHSATTSIPLSYSGVANGETGRVVFYVVGRRSGTTATSISGATQDNEDTSGSSAGDIRLLIGHEASTSDGSANTATAALASSQVAASAVFAFVPGSGSFQVQSKGNPTPPVQTTLANHTVPVLYDPAEKTVEVQL